MPTITSAPPGIRVEVLSGGGEPAPWTLAVFAHNEAGRIGDALESVAGAAGGAPVDVVVLANGCTDATVDEVRARRRDVPSLTLIDIDLADKAHAWNVHVHDRPEPPADRQGVHFFMDGDVRLRPGALVRLAGALEAHPTARAAGGMPATGRDRDGWRRRMVASGALAGNLYALRGTFLAAIRRAGIRMPTGLVGEDFLVSWLVARLPPLPDEIVGGPKCVFRPDAEFAFRSLSWWRPADYRTYARRKMRYARRGVQHQMLVTLLETRGLPAMPADIETLYVEGTPPSRLRWVGRDTPLRLWALLGLRATRRHGDRRAARSHNEPP